MYEVHIPIIRRGGGGGHTLKDGPVKMLINYSQKADTCVKPYIVNNLIR